MNKRVIFLFALIMSHWCVVSGGNLVVCPDCGNNVSRRALFCPTCGCAGDVIRTESGLEPIRIEPLKVRHTPFMLMAFSADANDAEVPQFKLVWQAVKGRTYGVFACSDLAKGWDSSPVATIEGTGELVEYVPLGVSAMMFFRVSVKLITDNKEGSDQ